MRIVIYGGCPLALDEFTLFAANTAIGSPLELFGVCFENQKIEALPFCDEMPQNVVYLNASNNALTSVFCYQWLTDLDLSKNKINHFPASLLRMPFLSCVDLSDNEIDEFPVFYEHSSVQYLNLRNNKLKEYSGDGPFQIWPSLSVLLIRGNPFSSYHSTVQLLMVSVFLYSRRENPGVSEFLSQSKSFVINGTSRQHWRGYEPAQPPKDEFAKLMLNDIAWLCNRSDSKIKKSSHSAE